MPVPAAEKHAGAVPARGSKKYTLLAAGRCPYLSEMPGRFGGHHKNKVYGRLDCRTALRATRSGRTRRSAAG
jgi:hypothetical protein